MTATSTNRKPRLTREAQKEARTALLLEAAWALFCEKGYEAVTIDQVAEYAGVSRMPVYYLFGDKQGLFLELWKKAVDDIIGTIRGEVRPGLPLRRNVRQLARLTVQGQTSQAPSYGENLFFVVQTIALSRPDIADKLQRISNDIVDFFAEIVRESTLEDGQKLRGTPAVVGAHLAALINGLSTLRFQTGRSVVRLRDLVDIFEAIVFAGPVTLPRPADAAARAKDKKRQQS